MLSFFLHLSGLACSLIYSCSLPQLVTFLARDATALRTHDYTPVPGFGTVLWFSSLEFMSAVDNSDYSGIRTLGFPPKMSIFL